MSLPYFKLPPHKRYLDLSLWPAPIAVAFVRTFKQLPVRPECFVLFGFASGCVLAYLLIQMTTTVPVYFTRSPRFARDDI